MEGTNLDADTVAMSDAYNGICGAIASLKKVTEEARPWAILTHLDVVRESLAGVLAKRTDTAHVENQDAEVAPRECPHCHNSEGLYQQDNGSWACLDCYWDQDDVQRNDA